MTIVMILAAALQVSERRSKPVMDALSFLARHQTADGSWGARPGACACPREKRILPGDPDPVAPLLFALGNDDPEKREAAQEELRSLGGAALPLLRAAVQDPDPEVRGRCAALCRWLDLAPRGGGDAELTALALLAFLGAGYTHFSKDVHDGLCFGEVVKKGVKWLLARQKETGAFDAEDADADSIAALALSQSFGLTASCIYSEEAQTGIDRTAATTVGETRGLIWKGMALKVAELGRLALPPKACEENFEALQARQGTAATAGYALISLLLRRRTADPRLDDLRALDPGTLETETLYFGTVAAFQFDGPDGSLWKGWHSKLKQRLLPAQRVKKGECEHGSWDGMGFRGRLQATALDAMDLEVYYRYRSVFSAPN